MLPEQKENVQEESLAESLLNVSTQLTQAAIMPEISHTKDDAEKEQTALNLSEGKIFQRLKLRV